MDIASISTIVAAGGVLIGVVLAYLEVRSLVRTRQTELVMGLYSTYGSKGFQEAYTKFETQEYKDFNGYVKKHGLSSMETVCILYEGIGVLLHKKLIDITLIDDLFSTPIKLTWEEMKPIIEGARKHYNRPQIYEWFEYLYNELQKREQTLQAQQ